MKRFPKEFLLGTSTAAHQVEGNNIHNDNWAQEHMPHSNYPEPSGIACDEYNRYEEDIKLMEKVGYNAYRFSLEWARIEPEEGCFNEEEIEHYRREIRCCKEHGITPLVTLFHFTSPVWLIQKGGWEAESTVYYFERYVRYVMEYIGNELSYVCTINEANQGLLIAGYIEEFERSLKQKQAQGIQVGIDLARMEENKKYAGEENDEVFHTQDPKIFSSPRTKEGDLMIMHAHQTAMKVIRACAPHVKAGLSLSVHDLQPYPENDAEAIQKTKEEWDKEFLHYLPYIQDDDYVGIQCYTRSLVGKDGVLPVEENKETTQMGYENYPECLEHALRKVAEDFKKDVIVTENGIAIADDCKRVTYLDVATQGVVNCLKDGLPVKGYFCWSLLDNYEWQKGYTQNFGLIAVNRNTMERIPKESFQFLGAMRQS